ncbi:MAG: hypothetical protein RR382_00120 [Tannerellaceae bacterium]
MRANSPDSISDMIPYRSSFLVNDHSRDSTFVRGYTIAVFDVRPYGSVTPAASNCSMQAEAFESD